MRRTDLLGVVVCSAALQVGVGNERQCHSAREATTVIS